MDVKYISHRNKFLGHLITRNNNTNKRKISIKFYLEDDNRDDEIEIFVNKFKTFLELNKFNIPIEYEIINKNITLINLLEKQPKNILKEFLKNGNITLDSKLIRDRLLDLQIPLKEEEYQILRQKEIKEIKKYIRQISEEIHLEDIQNKILNYIYYIFKKFIPNTKVLFSLYDEKIYNFLIY